MVHLSRWTSNPDEGMKTFSYANSTGQEAQGYNSSQQQKVTPANCLVSKNEYHDLWPFIYVQRKEKYFQSPEEGPYKSAGAE